MPVSVLPALALLLNAFVWGVSWWPFRILEGHGLHPLWSTAAIYAFALVCLLCWRPGGLRVLLRQPALWLLAGAAGITNVCFNWGVTQGDVVRVVLLFYLMPVWTAVLAWPLLGEKPTLVTLGRMALALAGVVVVLKTPEAPWPVPQSLPDWLGVAGGLSFSFTNILLLRLRGTPDAARTMAMFGGGCLAAIAAGCIGMAVGLVPGLPAPSALGGAGAGTAALLALGFLMGNVALQYGAARLPANVTSLVMLSEVVFASGSAVVLGASGLALHTVVGGLMVMAAALWSAMQ
jgi:drug/metabolite transporter (DMT)-like permease